MRFAGEDELDGSCRVVQQAGEPRRILEQQVRPLVAGEATREAEGQDVWIEHVRGLSDNLGQITAAGELPGQPSSSLCPDRFPPTFGTGIRLL
jgi:hypothetical protein